VWADDARSIVDSPHWTVTFDAGAPAVTGLPMRFRHPLVDLRLLRFVASLPPEPWLDNKHILRQVSGERLPQEIRQRPKTGLVASDLPGYEEGVREILADLVRRAPLPEHLVDKTALAAAVRTAAGKGGEWHYLALPLGLAAWQVHRARPVSTFPSQEPPRRL
jgi:asparagine synthase (glutamine-hydrolysing)